MSKRSDLGPIVDECLQAIAGGASLDECLRQHGSFRDELEPLLRAAAAVQSLPRVEPRATFAQASRQRLLERIRREPVATARSRLGGLLGFGRRGDLARLARPFPLSAAATIAVLVLTLTSGSGLVYAAQGSLPGQTLYSLKLASESVRIGLAGTEARRLGLRFDLADERLAEAVVLVDAARNDSAADAFEAYGRQVLVAATAAALVRVSDAGDAQSELHEHVGRQVTALLAVQRRFVGPVNTGGGGERARASGGGPRSRPRRCPATGGLRRLHRGG